MDYITTDWAIYKITKIDDYFIIMKNCRWNNKCPTYDFDELVVDRISGRMSRKIGETVTMIWNCKPVSGF